ncbi:MAG: alpha amylase C-terminal domain-containing protein [Desulfobacterales bacterium]|nr:alpha amylase C-terminal domain-containing protein [Desulfobacterales bacterium]
MTIRATSLDIDEIVERRIAADPYLKPYVEQVRRRIQMADDTQLRITGGKMDLANFASGHEYFGMHFADSRWIFREWAPNATAIYLKGSFNGWQADEKYSLNRITEDGIWEIELDQSDVSHGDIYRLEIHWPNGSGERIPAWVRRVVHDSSSLSFNAQVWRPQNPYVWQHSRPVFESDPLLVYETHVGMAQEQEKVGTFNEFKNKVLPRIKNAGYNTIQLMAIAEHPYYASFGYQVSNFFACSSRFGNPEELKALVDEAHSMGLLVLMDLVHSHAVKNEVEGIARFDGSVHQYFHTGSRGEHPAWDSRCFNYEKPQVLHFLLSNCRYWMDEFNFDGFRFDGVTSMLYTHHGLGKAFSGYADYFDDSVDEAALTYLTLANRLIHQLYDNAITVAEDVSGMPGLAVIDAEGGAGFDYRYAMGVPDYWIKLVKNTRDEHWSLGGLWYELTNRRSDEKTISYAESHDQALVGDQTLIFRLIGDRIYGHMSVTNEDLAVFRGISLHKMIRIATLATAGHGYLNFMGNEFGHPEWIDFPREGNQWSYKYARRQWHLVEDSQLRYRHLASFDRDMTALAKAHRIPNGQDQFLLHMDESSKVLAFLRDGLIFVFNFHPNSSYTDYWIPAAPGTYQILLDTDRTDYGGLDRQNINITHNTISDIIHRHFLSLYLPARTALVLSPVSDETD